VVELSSSQFMNICSISVAASKKTYRHLNDIMRKGTVAADYRQLEDRGVEAINIITVTTICWSMIVDCFL